MDINGNFYIPDIIRNWTEAVFGLGLRCTNKRNIKREIFLKYGIGPTLLYVTPLEKVETESPWSIKLTFVRNF
jgi:hypothetical protein